jgi:lipopolysaccharide/colanic/teichoic acid biosynthesis glycosyltransferase
MYSAPFSSSISAAPKAQAKTARRSPVAKRMLDFWLTAFGLLAIWPIFAIVAIAVKWNSKGPVFFVQTRIGQDGKPFGMIKFRSMYIDAEARRAALLAQSDRSGVCFKIKDDPRITSVGRVIRRLSLDELPQLINVLRGDMSLVGPRPALPEEVSRYPSNAMERLSVLPGITGPWQVSGRADLSFNQMIDLDIDYARRGTLVTDLDILRQTVSAVVSGRGAY